VPRAKLFRSSRGSAIVSVACGVLAAVAVRVYVARAEPGAAASVDAVQVVAAARPIARGSMVRASDLRLKRVPRSFAEPGAFSTISQAAGRVTLADLTTGETVTKTRLARVRAGPVASLVPEGLRAFAVPTSLPPGAVRPGDHVDVLATYAGSQPHTEAVVNDVQVLLALGPETSSGSAKSGGVSLDVSSAGGGSTVTLLVLVLPDQEQRLAYARAFGDLEVVIAPAR
jgi:pilus assembly protein CpaB